MLPPKLVREGPNDVQLFVVTGAGEHAPQARSRPAGPAVRRGPSGRRRRSWPLVGFAAVRVWLADREARVVVRHPFVRRPGVEVAAQRPVLGGAQAARVPVPVEGGGQPRVGDRGAGARWRSSRGRSSPGSSRRSPVTAGRDWSRSAPCSGSRVTKPVAIWDRVMLSESLALSLLALLVASLILFAPRPGWLRLVAVACVAGAWIARPRHDIYVVLGIGGRLGRPRGHRVRPALAVRGPGRGRGGGAAVVGGWLRSRCRSAPVRGGDPLRHVLADRILPYPDRLDWWQDHGMPQGPRCASSRSTRGTPTPARRPSARRPGTASSPATRLGARTKGRRRTSSGW